ncbi:hypothetical protein Tco_0389015 [Tanacetum coccineum]
MASNKDRIENLEAALGQIQDGIPEMKIGFADKFQHLEEIVTKLFDAVLSGKGGDNYKQVGRLMFYSKLTKLEFPTYRGDEDPTEWFTKVDQFFKNQGTPAYQEEGKEVTCDIFYEELWSRFGPTDCEDFDEALLKALVGTLIGGIVDGIRMFKPTNLKDATSLARMRDEQLNRLSPITQASSVRPIKNTTIKRLTWDEMQKKRAQAMASNTNRIKNLEDAVGQLQDGIAEMKIDFADKFQHLEDIMMKLSDAVLLGKGGDNYNQVGSLMFYSKLTKLEFPTYRGDEDPIEWFTKVD